MAASGPHPQLSVAPFWVELEPRREAVRVVPVGELDMATAGELAAKLEELRNAHFSRIVLDLRRLRFVDSTGVRLILAEHDRARGNGHEFALISGPPAIQRVLSVCGLLDQLPFCSP